MKIDLDKLKLQYISTGYGDDIKEVLDGGCNWIQLRIKNENINIIKDIAIKIKELCHRYDAVFIINDYVELAAEIDADGVHLGKIDMSPKDARTILGNGKCIGGTANTYNDILQLKDIVNYIGLGPYKWTSTKSNLSPILGIDGYKKILAELKKENINIPIISIGGIELEDVKELLALNISGIAVSGCIYNSNNRVALVNNFLEYLI